MPRRYLFLLITFSVCYFSLCRAAPAAGNHREQHLFSVAAFAADGRLWRLTPSQAHIAVDFSLDYGKTFSPAVIINQQAQVINLWDENPPSISIDKQGKVSVLYFADDKQANTSFFSQSADGEHFSEPVKISAHADSAYQYQAEMLVDQLGKLHFIWHDLRDKEEYKRQGGGDLSLYYLNLDPANNRIHAEEKRIAKNLCSCCRSSMALDVNGDLVILARFVYAGNVRDHGLLKIAANGKIQAAHRVSHDDWRLAGCPTHGPALSISADGRYHMAWFTLGKQRQGLFYAYSIDQGKHFSQPLAFGNPEHLPSRPDVLATGKQVVLTWKEFDGEITKIVSMQSNDRGKHWSSPVVLSQTSSASAHPALLSDGKRSYLSWNSLETGFQLIPIK